MAAKYFALLTSRGQAKLAQAAALGTQLKITRMGVGDGNGSLPTPDASQTALVHETRRAALNSLTVDPLNTSQIIAEQVIPENEGGWWIREIGLYDEAGDLIAVANCAETYKPELAEGSGRTQVIRMILIVSSTEAVTLKIDPSVVLATRKYVDDAVIEVKAYADSLMDAHIKAADPHTQYAPKASPTLTGTPKAPTAASGNNTTQIATTGFVQAALNLLKGDTPLTLDTLAEIAAAINNDPNFYTTMSSALALKAAIASPTFTGTPKAPTAAAGNNSTQLATTAFVQTAIAQLVASAPGALDTLNELAAALGDDPNFAATITNQLALKAPLASPAFTGTPTAPTAGASTNNMQIATTAFVQALMKAHLDAADPHTQYLETNNKLSEYAAWSLGARLGVTDNINAVSAFATGNTTTRLDDASVTSKTQFISVTGNVEDGPQGNTSYAALLLNIRRAFNAGTSLVQLMFSGGVFYIRTASGGEGAFSWGATALNANGWRKIYDEYNTPTPQEVGALPLPKVNFSGDLNTVTDPGVYSITSAAGNGPVGSSGVMTVLAIANGATITQDFISISSTSATINRRWCRFGILSSGVATWQPWTPLTLKPTEIGTGQDLDVLVETGKYYGGGYVHGPSAIGGAYAMVDVTSNGANTVTVQTLHTTSSSQRFSRSYTSANGWSEWEEEATLNDISNNLVPVGIIMTWPTNTAPDGWIKCNGASFSATAYPELAKVYPALKVPDLRGEFIRGFDDSRGVDSGRGIGTNQAATQIRTSLMDYNGSDTASESWAGIAFANADAQNSYTSSLPSGAKTPGGGTLAAITWDNVIKGTQDAAALNSAGSPWISTRPRNVAFNFIVRAA